MDVKSLSKRFAALVPLISVDEDTRAESATVKSDGPKYSAGEVKYSNWFNSRYWPPSDADTSSL